MAGRFPLYTDADVYGPLVEALMHRGWNVMRAVDAFPEGTEDVAHFERAAQLGRVMVSNDRDVRRLAVEWLRHGRPFHGLIAWPQALHARMTVGEIVDAFDELARQENAFDYPIQYLKPRI